MASSSRGGSFNSGQHVLLLLLWHAQLHNTAQAVLKPHPLQQAAQYASYLDGLADCVAAGQALCVLGHA